MAHDVPPDSHGVGGIPMFIMLNGKYVTANAWWPLNILFMLLLVVL
jgi:hypothetical protein